LAAAGQSAAASQPQDHGPAALEVSHFEPVVRPVQSAQAPL
jgi:hypothetical protein